ncbi:MAG: discoidin domain-containing protein, partial [Verrucomicrobia bacterium]|nr:discoidin domain-containing protein [Verrucomicrobiota bacterium]
DEFHPALFRLTATLDVTGGARRGWHPVDSFVTEFGLRHLSTAGTQFTMNGRPLFLRGTLECQVFPLTGYPPCEVEAWRRIFRIEKSYGLNFIRFHSWCPPEAAFAAADREGIVIQAEAPQANVNAGSDPQRDAFTEAELRRMIRTYGNHPSFCLLTLGNEYGGQSAWLTHWVDMLIQADPRHLYSSPSAGQETTNRQWTEGTFGRGVHGPGTTSDVRAAIAHETVPPVGHEIGQWVVFPNFDEAQKYTGVMRPTNFEIIRDDLKAKGMLDLAPRFFQATGNQAGLLYKEEIELLLRTPGLAGFSLLDLHDYPGQGTATVGLLDPFWDAKGFIQPGQFRRFCGPVVPLLRMPKRTYTAGETFSAAAEIANYSAQDIRGATPYWTITDARGRPMAGGALDSLTAPTGRLSPLGAIRASLAKAAAPCQLTVTVGLKGTRFSNGWNIWVYPDDAAPQPPANVVLSTAWDEPTKAALAEGKTVLLLPAKQFLHRSLGGSFLPTFWSPVWFPLQRPDTMSILCHPRQPLFAQFPTAFYSDWQWYDLQQNSRPVILDHTPAGFRPLVQVIDNFARNHKLGDVFEARVGSGKLLVCTIDLTADLKSRPAARQFARSLFAYLGSPQFQPRHKLDIDLLDKLFLPTATGAHVKSVRADSEQDGYPAANAVDGDPDTLWHTAWEGDAVRDFPHQLVIELDAPESIAGFTALPRQDGNHNGWIRAYALFVSNDGTNWGEPVAKGVFPNDRGLKRVKFGAPVTARFVKLEALSGQVNGPWASLAELNLIQAGQ